MLKKIIYIIVAVVLGFVIFYMSWNDSRARAFVNRANKALKEGNYEFFLKLNNYYEKDPIFVENYTKEGNIIGTEEKENNTTSLRAYNMLVEVELEDKTREYRSGVFFIITDVNTDIVPEETSEPSSDLEAKDALTKMIITCDNGKTYEIPLSTYGYSSTPYISTLYTTKELKEEFTDDSHSAPTCISNIKLVAKEDIEDKDEIVFFDNDVTISFEEHNEESYWKDLVDQNKAGVLYTAKEFRDSFTFAFPEMTRTFVITGVAFLVLAGLGVFVFWPKKSFVPKEDEDREKYTFASTEEKEQYAIAKVARSKKEKEDRENRYKNVRSNKSLDEITEEKLEESIDKENTFEQAVEEDKTLENEEKKEEN